VAAWAEETGEEEIMVPAVDAEGTMDLAEAQAAEAKVARGVDPVAVVDLILGVAKVDRGAYQGVDVVDAVDVATSRYLNSLTLYFR
jgi:hypothetical protein